MLFRSLLEEATLRRYPRLKDVLKLMAFAIIENVGYRQVLSIFRVQGVFRYFAGVRRWEKVEHRGIGSGYSGASS